MEACKVALGTIQRLVCCYTLVGILNKKWQYDVARVLTVVRCAKAGAQNRHVNLPSPAPRVLGSWLNVTPIHLHIWRY